MMDRRSPGCRFTLHVYLASQASVCHQAQPTKGPMVMEIVGLWIRLLPARECAPMRRWRSLGRIPAVAALRQRARR